MTKTTMTDLEEKRQALLKKQRAERRRLREQIKKAEEEKFIALAKYFMDQFGADSPEEAKLAWERDHLPNLLAWYELQKRKAANQQVKPATQATARPATTPTNPNAKTN